jgi:hypothetical protein
METEKVPVTEKVPGVFFGTNLDAKMIAEVIDPKADTDEKILFAAKICPTKAISLEEEGTGKKFFQQSKRRGDLAIDCWIHVPHRNQELKSIFLRAYLGLFGYLLNNPRTYRPRGVKKSTLPSLAVPYRCRRGDLLLICSAAS